MASFFSLVFHVLASPFRSRARLEAEVVFLRHQLNVLRRQARAKPRLTTLDRWLFVWLYWVQPSLSEAMVIVKPETVIRWHRTGFRLYWRWKSRSRGGRPNVSIELRSLIRRMSLENPLWGAPRIHGELLKLGFELAQSTVAKYMVKRRPGGAGQTWKTLRRILSAYADYYNNSRPHLSLAKDSPYHRPIQSAGTLVSRPILGGLHHHYCRT